MAPFLEDHGTPLIVDYNEDTATEFKSYIFFIEISFKNVTFFH